MDFIFLSLLLGYDSFGLFSGSLCNGFLCLNFAHQLPHRKRLQRGLFAGRPCFSNSLQAPLSFQSSSTFFIAVLLSRNIDERHLGNMVLHRNPRLSRFSSTAHRDLGGRDFPTSQLLQLKVRAFINGQVTARISLPQVTLRSHLRPDSAFQLLARSCLAQRFLMHFLAYLVHRNAITGARTSNIGSQLHQRVILWLGMRLLLAALFGLSRFLLRFLGSLLRTFLLVDFLRFLFSFFDRLGLFVMFLMLGNKAFSDSQE